MSDGATSATRGKTGGFRQNKKNALRLLPRRLPATTRTTTERRLTHMLSLSLLIPTADTLSTAGPAMEAVRRVSAAGAPCADAKHSPLRSSVALQFAGAREQAVSCLLSRLAGRSELLLWARAAALLPEEPAIAAHATALFGTKPCTASPASWDVLGPLPIGKNEVDGDPLEDMGGAFAYWLAGHNASASGVGALCPSLGADACDTAATRDAVTTRRRRLLGALAHAAAVVARAPRAGIASTALARRRLGQTRAWPAAPPGPFRDLSDLS